VADHDAGNARRFDRRIGASGEALKLAFPFGPLARLPAVFALDPPVVAGNEVFAIFLLELFEDFDVAGELFGSQSRRGSVEGTGRACASRLWRVKLPG
jgi:hypothetical protein